MTPSELYDLFRADLVDKLEPYLWSDPEVYAYMNDAYFMFIRLTGGIPDRTSSITLLKAEAGKSTTRLDDSILRIRTARNETENDRPIRIINTQDIDDTNSYDYGAPLLGAGSRMPGRIDYMIIGEEEGVVRWVKTPDFDQDIRITVERQARDPITPASTEFTGVRQEHHYHLLKWMRHLAYRKQDADTFDLVKSDQERDDFIAYTDMAKNEKETRRHKVRTTGYGGI